MALIRRHKLPETITTREVAARWKKSPERVRQLLKSHGVARTQIVSATNAAFDWNLAQVREVEKRIFGVRG